MNCAMPPKRKMPPKDPPEDERKLLDRIQKASCSPNTEETRRAIGEDATELQMSRCDRATAQANFFFLPDHLVDMGELGSFEIAHIYEVHYADKYHLLFQVCYNEEQADPNRAGVRLLYQRQGDQWKNSAKCAATVWYDPNSRDVLVAPNKGAVVAFREQFSMYKWKSFSREELPPWFQLAVWTGEEVGAAGFVAVPKGNKPTAKRRKK